MKSKRRWLLLLPVFVLFAWAYQVASWRPKLVGVRSVVLRGNGLPPIGFFPKIGPSLLVSPDGKRLISTTINGTSYSVNAWDVATRQKLWPQELNGAAYNFLLALSPDGRAVATLREPSPMKPMDSTLVLLDTATGKPIQTLKAFWKRDVLGAAFLSNLEMVVCASEGAYVVDLQTGRLIRHWAFDKVALATPGFDLTIQNSVSADGTTVMVLISANGATDNVFYNSNTGKQLSRWKSPQLLTDPQLSPDGKLVAIARQGTDFVEIFDVSTGTKLWGMSPQQYSSSWVWSADGQRVFSFLGASLGIFDARTGRELGQLPVHRNTRALALDSDGDFYYTFDDEGKIWRWRLR